MARDHRDEGGYRRTDDRRRRSRDRTRRSRSRSPQRKDNRGRSDGHTRRRSTDRRTDFSDKRRNQRDGQRHEKSADERSSKPSSHRRNKFIERAERLGIPTGLPPSSTLEQGVDGQSSSTILDVFNGGISTSRITDQIKQRKLLWSKPATQTAETEASKIEPKSPGSSTKLPESVNHWAKATFKGDDGKTTAKFRRLMGIKDEDIGQVPNKKTPETLGDQDELFSHLERQYQVARQSTHTQKGMGLGWGR